MSTPQAISVEKLVLLSHAPDSQRAPTFGRARIFSASPNRPNGSE
jgi:hypothetical protein